MNPIAQNNFFLTPWKSGGDDVSGASELEFHGSPANNAVSISGASRVIGK